MQTQNSNQNISRDRVSKMSTNSDKIRQSKIFLEEIQTNNDYLIRRQGELEQIKKISSQIKDITNMLVEETKKQGEELSN